MATKFCTCRLVLPEGLSITLSLPVMKKAFIQLHTAIFFAGFTAVLGKLILLNEAMLVWYRLIITIFVLTCGMMYKRQLQLIPLRDMCKIAGVGLILAIHWVSFYGSVKYANISVALVCFSATGFFTALLEPLLLRKKLVPVELGLGILAMSGIYVIFDFHPQYKMGIFFGVFSAMGSAVFPIMNQQLLHRFTPKTLTLYELGGGFLLMSLILPFYLGKFPASYYWPSNSDWVWLVILAVLCTVIAFDLQLRALRKISAFTANLSYNLEPVYGIILAFIFFGESKMLHAGFFIGLSLIILAIVLQMILVWWRIKKNRNLA